MVNVPWCHDCDEPLSLCKCMDDAMREVTKVLVEENVLPATNPIEQARLKDEEDAKNLTYLIRMIRRMDDEDPTIHYYSESRCRELIAIYMSNRNCII